MDLSKDSIKKYILPHLQVESSGKFLDSDFMIEFVSTILYRLKTGMRWRFLAVKYSFSSRSLTWQGFYFGEDKRWFLDKSW